MPATLPATTHKWPPSRRKGWPPSPRNGGRLHVGIPGRLRPEYACREGFTALYHRLPRLLPDLAIAKADGRYGKLLTALARTEVLVLDDWGLLALTDGHRRDLLEIVEDRYDRRSTIVTSQLPVNSWHDAIGDATLADAILDRLVHNAHRLALKGKESIRKTKAVVAA